jgi:hypothetical protein
MMTHEENALLREIARLAMCPVIPTTIFSSDVGRRQDIRGNGTPPGRRAAIRAAISDLVGTAQDEDDEDEGVGDGRPHLGVFDARSGWRRHLRHASIAVGQVRHFVRSHNIEIHVNHDYALALGQFIPTSPDRIYVAPLWAQPSTDYYAHVLLHETVHLIRHTHFHANLKSWYLAADDAARMRYIHEEFVADVSAVLLRRRITGQLPLHILQRSGSYVRYWGDVYPRPDYAWLRAFDKIVDDVEGVVDHLTTPRVTTIASTDDDGDEEEQRHAA